jgi:hypothetical protein
MFRLFAAFLAGIVLLAAVAPAQAQTGPLVVPLVGPADASGRATVTAGSGDAPVRLVLEVQGLRAGAEHVAHVHAGTPAQPSASTGTLGRFTADAEGRGRLETTTARAGAAGAPVDLRLEWLADGDHFLDVHDGTATVALGEIPALGRAPTQLPRTGDLPLAVLAGLGLLLTAAALLGRTQRPMGRAR